MEREERVGEEIGEKRQCKVMKRPWKWPCSWEKQKTSEEGGCGWWDDKEFEALPQKSSQPLSPPFLFQKKKNIYIYIYIYIYIIRSKK